MKTVIEMAREAGFWKDLFAYPEFKEHVERFAALVREDEREACAKVCEDLINEETCYVWIPDARGAVNNCAAAIRARGE